MLTLNKYIRELGWDEHTWPFNEILHNELLKVEDKKYDKRYIDGEYEEGFIDAEFFSLDVTLRLEIYSRLCYFRDHCVNGCPGYFESKYGDNAFDKWKEIIDAMILSFKLQLEDDHEIMKGKTKREQHIISKNRQKKIEYGKRLFIKYLDNLWW